MSSLLDSDVVAARDELERAPKAVSDRVAKLLAVEVRGPRKSDTMRVLRELGPVWFASGKRRLISAVLRAMDGPEAMRTVAHLEGLPPRPSPGGRSLGARLASVFVRAWVLAVLGPALLIAIPVFALSAPTRAVIAIGTGVASVLAVSIDAFLRRCPRCRKLLAGVVESIHAAGSYTTSVLVDSSAGSARIDQTRTSYAHRFRCAHCDHVWER